MDDGGDYLMSFADFLYAFQLQFYYQGKHYPFEYTIYYFMLQSRLQADHFYCTFKGRTPMQSPVACMLVPFYLA